MVCRVGDGPDQVKCVKNKIRNLFRIVSESGAGYQEMKIAKCIIIFLTFYWPPARPLCLTGVCPVRISGVL